MSGCKIGLLERAPLVTEKKRQVRRREEGLNVLLSA